jgi:peptidoglycan/LPS O-acetylase OafA/YrhL
MLVSSSAFKWRKDIQGLRAFAIIPVLLFHYNSLLRGGFLGVDLFFVISGYVIAKTILSNKYHVSFLRLFVFIHRRFLRIMPTLLLWVPVFSIISYFFYSNWIEKTSLLTGLASLFGASNLFLVYNSLDYFSPSSASNVFIHLWTISVEDQFYLTFALSLYVFNKYLKGKINTTMIILVLLMICFVGIIKGPASTYIDFYLPYSRFYEFGLGAFTYYLSCTYMFKFSDKTIVDVICLIVMLFFYFGMNSQSISNFYYMLFCVCSAVLLYPCDKSYVQSFLSSKIFCFVGGISYSIYVIHLPFVRLLGLFYDLSLSHYGVFFFYIAGTFALSVINYHLVELKYLRKYRFSQLRSLDVNALNFSEK